MKPPPGTLRTVPGLIAAVLLVSCGAEEERPDILLIVVDTLRADALGCYGGVPLASPGLDALAARGVQFRTCVSQAPWTLPAVGTVLTGRYPSFHGANRLLRPVAPSTPLLSETLRASGYATAALVSNHFLEEKYDLHRGFDLHDVSFAGDESSVSSAAITDAAVEWLETAPSPAFLFLFYMDPHYRYVRHDGDTRASPYDGPVRPGADIWELRALAPSLVEADVRRLRELYAGEVRHLDRELRRLFAYLEESGRIGNTVVVFTADHGEEFLEHGWIGHTRNLHGDLLRVPLILHAPSRLTPELRNDPAMLVDVRPTLLHLAGIPDGGGPGRDLFAGDRTPRPIYSEVTYDPQAVPPQSDPARERRRQWELTKIADMKALREGDWKAIRNRLTGAWELYDLARDPGETRDLAAERPGILARLRSALPAPGPFDTPEGEATVGITPEEIERLRHLGYVR